VCEVKYTREPQHACLYYYSSEYTFIAELEKIKAEIIDIEEPDHDFEGFYYCFEEALKIINKHIIRTEMENKQ
jgi:hypothetical protein